MLRSVFRDNHYVSDFEIFMFSFGIIMSCIDPVRVRTDRGKRAIRPRSNRTAAYTSFSGLVCKYILSIVLCHM